jgi:uncharacterized protein YndB with AHSA1/START domain
MSEIRILFHITAPREKVYEALTTIEGLAGWWTKQTCGDSRPGGIIRFRFGELGNDMKVLSMKKTSGCSGNVWMGRMTGWERG